MARKSPLQKQAEENLKKNDGKKNPRGKKYQAIAYAERRILFNWDRQDILEAIINHYGYSESSAIKCYEAAMKRVKQKYIEYQEQIAEENYKRLNAIVDEAFDNGDLKTSIDAINVINKMGNIYEQKINIKSDEGFTIKLDN